MIHFLSWAICQVWFSSFSFFFQFYSIIWPKIWNWKKKNITGVGQKYHRAENRRIPGNFKASTDDFIKIYKKYFFCVWSSESHQSYIIMLWYKAVEHLLGSNNYFSCLCVARQLDVRVSQPLQAGYQGKSGRRELIS